jgi:hypothetical protein
MKKAFKKVVEFFKNLSLGFGVSIEFIRDNDSQKSKDS